MKKTFMERIFPYSPESILPQHERSRVWDTVQNPSIATSSTLDPSDGSQSLLAPSISTLASQRLSPRPRNNPLRASLLHHDDPFLPVERAARALQDTIQSLLNAQSTALEGKAGIELEDLLSDSSLTPTPSVTSGLRSTHGRTMPIRQPPQKKITLRGARKGLRKSMHDFAKLREQELQILEYESKTRTHALQRVVHFEERKNSLQKKITSIKAEEQSDTGESFRAKAAEVESEIQELEHRLLELRVRQRHLISQAEQVESTLEAKSSSYQNTLALMDRETKDFLRHPPISSSLVSSPLSGMYALQPQRRTLQMAKEQWTNEQETLVGRKIDVEAELKALLEGERVWSDTLKLIDRFEKRLRSTTSNLSLSMTDTTENAQETFTQGLLIELNTLIGKLQSDFDHAQEQNWNLLVCILGAELQACSEAQKLLQTDRLSSGLVADGLTEHGSILVDTAEGQVTARQSPQKPAVSPTHSDHSNQSLKDTLAEFRSDAPTALLNAEEEHGREPKARYESEDDDPPPDFLLSR